MSNRRRRLYIPPTYLSRLVIAPTAFFVVAINATIILGFLLDEPLFIAAVTSNTVIGIAVVELLVLGIAIAGLMVTAHRVAGPLYALEKALERMGQGDLGVRLSFRKNDYHSQLMGVFNDNIGKLERHVSELQSSSDKPDEDSKASTQAEFTNTRKTNQGITLIELMVVVAIISILILITMPMYSNFTARTRVGEGIALVGQFKQSVAEYYLTNANWPANNNAAGLEDDIFYNTGDVSKVNVTGGIITIYYDIPALGANNTIEFEPTIIPGGIEWLCSGGSVETYFRPPVCRN